MKNLKRLIFDADDTLWQNNIFYEETSETFFKMSEEAGYNRKEIENEFDDLELWIVRERGYGSENYVFILRKMFNKYFNKDTLKDFNKQFEELIYEFNQHTRRKPPILEGVEDVLNKLRSGFEMYVLTKGNQEEQKRKLKNSGLWPVFDQVFVVNEKDINTYKNILNEHDWHAQECCMIGNSPKSDINPALRIGMYAIFIPYEYTWKLDNEPVLKDHEKLHVVRTIREIPVILKSL